MKKTSFVTTLMLCTSIAAVAHADEGAARADRLFKEGTEALDKHLFDEACPKLAESRKLDPKALGTLVNLARCNEEWGKTATAYAQYGELEAAAKERKQTARVELAQRRRRDLTAKLSRITIKLNERLPGETVKVDGEEWSSDRWSNPFVIDPGSHVVEVAATDRETWKHPFDLPPAANDTIEVPALVKHGGDVVVATPPPQTPPTTVTTVEPPKEEPKSDSRKTVGFVVGGVGIAALGAGAVFGILAIGKKGDVDSLCNDDATKCSPEQHAKAQDAYDSGKTFATLSTVLVPVGLVAMGVGAFFIFTAPKNTARIAVTPMVGQQNGASMRVTF